MNNCLDLSLLGLIGDKIYEPLIDSLSISLDGTCCKLIFSWLCRECIYVINITCIKDNLIISSLFEPTSSFASDFALSKLHNSYWYEVCCFLTQFFDSQDFVILLVILKILKCQKRRLTHAQSLRQVSGQHVRIRKAIECFHNRNSFVLNNSQKHKKIWFRNSFGPTNFFDDLSVALYCLEDSLNDSHNWPGIFLVGTILRINILEVIFNWFEVIFHLVEENIFLSWLNVLIFWFLFSQATNFEFKLLNLIALQIDELEHLKILLFVSTENTKKFIKVINLCSSFDFGKIFSKLLNFFHLLWTFLGLSEIRIYFTSWIYLE